MRARRDAREREGASHEKLQNKEPGSFPEEGRVESSLSRLQRIFGRYQFEGAEAIFGGTNCQVSVPLKIRFDFSACRTPLTRETTV